MLRALCVLAFVAGVSAQTTKTSKTIILSGAGTTNPQNYFRTVMEYLTVESKLSVSIMCLGFVASVNLLTCVADKSSLSGRGFQYWLQGVHWRKGCNAVRRQICGYRQPRNYRSKIHTIERFWRWRYSHVGIKV